jgi:hypothetical protein
MAKRKGSPEAASSEERDAALIMGPARRFFIDHLLFCGEPEYRRLLARRIAVEAPRVGRIHLSFKCQSGCCELVDPRTAANFLLSRRWAA